MRKIPSLLLVVSREVPVALCLAVTLAPAMTALFGSLIVPVRLVVAACCAGEEVEHRQMIANANAMMEGRNLRLGTNCQDIVKQFLSERY